MVARRRLRVHRKGYKRKGHMRREYMRDHVIVPAARVAPSRVPPATFTIRDIGAVGRGKKLFKVKKGLLKKHGYGTHLPAEERHAALRKADKAYGSVRLFKMLNAQLLFRKRLPDGVKEVFQADRDWVLHNLLNPQEARSMTAPAVRKWERMTHAERVSARR